MKKLIILSTIILTAISCKVTEKPEFLRVKNIDVIESKGEFIKLSADAFFNNPNDVGGELMTEGIKVIVNDVEMAIISSESFKVPAKNEFSIPLTASIPKNKILDIYNLGGFLNSILNKKVKVQYIGDIKYKVLGFSHTYSVDMTEDVKIKL